MSEDCFRSCLTNKRQKVEVKSPNSTKFFSLCLGYTETWSSSRINCRASVVHNMLKWSSTENKFYITTSIICWWHYCCNFKQEFRRFLLSVEFSSL